MTTTAATTHNNSASNSIPNDSPKLREFDRDGASESLTEHQQREQEHDDTQSQSPVSNLTPNKTPPNPTTSSSSPGTKVASQHEQKRPMNAFLLYCKRQRSSVKEKYPNLENREITKILGDWWSKLDKEQKSKYTDLARQHKEAFMKAHPDFKWCKTPNVSNINNNTNNESYSNSSAATNQNQQQQPKQQQQHVQSHSQRHQQNHQPTAATNAELLSLQSNHHPMDVVNHSSNSMDIMLTSRQQLEAPKPPKKRFLERNDSIYTAKNNHTSNHHETNSHGADVAPCEFVSYQDTLERAVDIFFKDDSSSSPSGANSCKGLNRNQTNLTSTSSNNQASFSSSSTSNNYTTNTDEPVDFSMNRTFTTTRQKLIDNLVENMLSEPSDDSTSFSKSNGTDSVRSHMRQPVKRDNPDDT